MIGTLSPHDMVLVLSIGLITGLTGGMLGVGGSIVLIPALTEFRGPDQHLYQATAMIVNFFVVTPAVIRHRRAGAIQWDTIRYLLPIALIAVLIGVGISELSLFAGRGEAYLRTGFGLLLLSVASIDLLRLLRPKPVSGIDEPPLTRKRKGAGMALYVAVPTGLIAGLFGVGGGVVAVPLQRRLFNIPIRHAIANSATIIIVTSLAGSITKNYAYITEHQGRMDSLLFAALLIPTAILGSWIGATGTHRIPIRMVKIGFFVILTIAAIRMIMGGITDLPPL